ncbi:family 32 glycosyltransferase [Dactylonectria macrodidyma]|uniref:Family 32 glycosyltransferase n=1 Tax=Dactylonectria macrodidyma TaxID=307937 RepID=A0A9P9E5L9_9HYPO|nr:family 32 glycosyltransferase [Dactylonectria macrodidyma]
MPSRPRPNAPPHLRFSPLTPVLEKIEHAGDYKDVDMYSPLGSPTLAASTAKLRNKVPAQMVRYIRLYVACVCVLLLLLNFDVVPAMPRPWKMFQRKPVHHDPLHQGSSFPQKIWQTWKVSPLDFDERDNRNARSWLTKNPGWRYEVLTDLNEMTYIEQFFGRSGFNRPDIVEFYRAINIPIVKADLLRYMIMYAEGGVYADIDVEALRPLHRFIPERYDDRDIDMIVGIEIDQPEFRDHPILGKKSMSFCQWTIISRPQQPVLLRLIDNIMTWFKDLAKQQGVSLANVELDFDQVISGTGPSAFTAALIEEMNKKTREEVTWDMFHNLDESKVVGRVLVQNVEAFCAGQGHSDSGNHNSRGALVKHHYHASNWPSRHHRFRHPVYGQVEDCNWDWECVKRWDESVAQFDTLAEEEKKQMIENAQKEEEEKNKEGE